MVVKGVIAIRRVVCLAGSCRGLIGVLVATRCPQRETPLLLVKSENKRRGRGRMRCWLMGLVDASYSRGWPGRYCCDSNRRVRSSGVFLCAAARIFVGWGD